MNSGDIVIRTERTLNDVIYEIDGKITSLQQELAEFRKEFDTFRQETRSNILELRNEHHVINERMNSLNDRLSTMQYTLNFAVSVGGLLLVALPLMWGLRKLFTFSIRDAIREAVRAELESRE